MIDGKIIVVLLLLLFLMLYNNYQNLGMSRLNKSKLNSVYRGVFFNKKFNLIILCAIIFLSSIVFLELNGIKLKQDDADNKKKYTHLFSTTKALY